VFSRLGDRLAPGSRFEASTAPSSEISTASARSARYRARVRIHRDLAGWGVFFIVAGGVPLAVQTGLLDPAVLDRWWSYWPLILIGIGLGLIFTRTPLEIVGGLIVSGTFGLLAAGILTGGFGGIGEFPSIVCGPGGGGTPFPPRSGSFGSDAAVRVEIDCGTVEVRTTDGDMWTVEGVDEGGIGPSVEADGDSLDITSPDGNVSRFLGERDLWVVRLPTAHRLDLHLTVDAGEAVADLDGARHGVIEVELNAGSATVDLRDVTEIEGIDVGINAGSLGLDLPAVSTTGSIEANAGSVRLCAPEGVALRLDTSGSALSSQDFASAGLVEVDDAWETPGYDTAVTRIELETQANAGSFRLNPPEGCS
jgi:LiaF transmembrane domain